MGPTLSILECLFGSVLKLMWCGALMRAVVINYFPCINNKKNQFERRDCRMKEEKRNREEVMKKKDVQYSIIQLNTTQHTIQHNTPQHSSVPFYLMCIFNAYEKQLLVC